MKRVAKNEDGAILILVLVVVVIMAAATAAVAEFAFTGPRAQDAHTNRDRTVSALGTATQAEIENIRLAGSAADCKTLHLDNADGPRSDTEPVSRFGNGPVNVSVSCQKDGDTFHLCATDDAHGPTLSVQVAVDDRVLKIERWQLTDTCEAEK